MMKVDAEQNSDCHVVNLECHHETWICKELPDHKFLVPALNFLCCMLQNLLNESVSRIKMLLLNSTHVCKKAIIKTAPFT